MTIDTVKLQNYHMTT